MRKLIYLMFSILIFYSCSSKNKDFIVVQGVVDAEIVTMKSAVSGKIKKIYFETGESIKKGSLLIEIDKKKLENRLKNIEISLDEIKVEREKLKIKTRILNEKIEFLKRQYERFKRLRVKNAISGEKLESEKLSLDEALSSKDEIKKTLNSLILKEKKLLNEKDYIDLQISDFEIVFPVEGEILEKFVNEGEYVFTGTPLFDIYKKESLHIEVFLEEKELGKLKLNEEVKIVMDGAQEIPLKGKIVYFGKKAEFSPKYIVSEKERKELLYYVKIKVLNHKELYKIGMPVTVYIKND